MIYTEGKILVRIKGDIVIVNATRPEDDISKWEREMEHYRQWVILGHGYKYHIHPNQVIGRYNPLKPVNYLKRKIKL